VDGQKLFRPVKAAGSYASTNEKRTVIGLGSTRKIDRLTVKWPSGKDQTWSGEALPVDRYWYLSEGDEAPRDQPY
jgi:hypothetical protein